MMLMIVSNVMGTRDLVYLYFQPSIFGLYNMAAAAMLGFQKFEILTVRQL